MDMGMGMGMAGFVEDLDQLLAAMSLGSSATSSEPIAAAPPAAADLRRGPWTVDEDILLVNYIAAHGEGRWNSLARSAGLKRIGKSCRLRWLNYLRPDLRRDNITAEEQLLILDLHSRWGNRWSKIAQHLPGRTDNEVKNYWRTRVQKQARHLHCDVNSAHFRHVVRHVWMPRLQERAQTDREDQQGVHAAIEAHHQYYSEGPPGWTAAATALSPDDASSALPAPSSLTADDASNYTAAYTSAARSAATATPTTNDQQGCRPVVLHQCGADDARTGPTTTDAAGDDDVFAGTTWSELLATTTGGPDDHSSSMSMIGLQLQDFGFGDFEDGLWSLDDLCCAELNC